MNSLGKDIFLIIFFLLLEFFIDETDLMLRLTDDCLAKARFSAMSFKVFSKSHKPANKNANEAKPTDVPPAERPLVQPKKNSADLPPKS